MFGIAQSVYYYVPKPSDDGPVMDALRELADVHSGWGFWMMFHRLRQCAHAWNHKKVYRIYTAMGLNMRRKYKKRLPARKKEPLTYPIAPNIAWSMDFMHDGLACGKPFRSFNVIDDFSREALNITIDTCLSSKRVIRELENLIDWRGKPEKIRVDNGPEFVAQAMEDWAERREIELTFIQKGKPYQNGLVERFNRTYREEVLDRFLFDNLRQTQAMTNAWMWTYNNERPHSSLLYNTPTQFLLKYGKLGNGQQGRLDMREFPTFQQEVYNNSSSNDNWKCLVLNAT
jgi:putative transposase